MKKMSISTTKEKCTMLLLSCLNWGCKNVYGSKEEVDGRIKNKLKFQYECDSLRFRSCIDLIDDTENAIIYFSTFGLEKFSAKANKNLGELYLKLYGILNAIYLQMNAIIQLHEICKIPNKKSITDEFHNHDIFELRNIVGAHTPDFEDKSDYMPQKLKQNSYRITQMNLNAKGNNLHAIDSFYNLKEFNLYELVMSYNALAEIILYSGCNDYLSRIFRNSISKKIELLNYHELIEFKNYDYRKLYENDKLYKNYLERIHQEITTERQSQESDV